MADYIAQAKIQSVDIIFPQGPDKGLMSEKVFTKMANELYAQQVQYQPGAEGKILASFTPCDVSWLKKTGYKEVNIIENLYIYANF
jgi:hypothetical protein